MSFYRFVPLILASILSCAAGPVSAQDATQATVAEGMGQGIGEAASGGQSVFVTATGRETRPAAPEGVYLINFEGHSASAVEAAKQCDDRLVTAQVLAQKFGISVEPASGGIEREAAPQTSGTDVHPARGAHSTSAQPAEAGQVFVARTSARFSAADPTKVPAFLDALIAAGLEADIMKSLPALNSADTFDDAVWDHASLKAVASALHQAQVLAKAAGREVGDAEQIMVLSKTVQGSQASLTISVRYLLK